MAESAARNIAESGFATPSASETNTCSGRIHLPRPSARHLSICLSGVPFVTMPTPRRACARHKSSADAIAGASIMPASSRAA